MAALVTIQNSRNKAGDIRETTWPIWRRPWWWLGGMVVGQVGRLDAKMEQTHRQFLFPRDPYIDFSPCVENFRMHCGFGNKFGRKCRSSENFHPATLRACALPVGSLGNWDAQRCSAPRRHWQQAKQHAKFSPWSATSSLMLSNRFLLQLHDKICWVCQHHK